jgi:hypothetical protein
VTAQVSQRHLSNIDAIQEDLALLGLIEATEQTDDTAFTGSGRPNQRQTFPLAQGEGDIVQHLIPPGIGK